MAINKKFLYFLNKDSFNKELESGNILNTSLVFIEETKQFYVNGNFFSENTLYNLLTLLDSISDTKLLDTDTSNEAIVKLYKNLNEDTELIKLLISELYNLRLDVFTRIDKTDLIVAACLTDLDSKIIELSNILENFKVLDYTLIPDRQTAIGDLYNLVIGKEYIIISDDKEHDPDSIAYVLKTYTNSRSGLEADKIVNVQYKDITSKFIPISGSGLTSIDSQYTIEISSDNNFHIHAVKEGNLIEISEKIHQLYDQLEDTTEIESSVKELKELIDYLYSDLGKDIDPSGSSKTIDSLKQLSDSIIYLNDKFITVDVLAEVNMEQGFYPQNDTELEKYVWELNRGDHYFLEIPDKLFEILQDGGDFEDIGINPNDVAYTIYHGYDPSGEIHVPITEITYGELTATKYISLPITASAVTALRNYKMESHVFGSKEIDVFELVLQIDDIIYDIKKLKNQINQKANITDVPDIVLSEVETTGGVQLRRKSTNEPINPITSVECIINQDGELVVNNLMLQVVTIQDNLDKTSEYSSKYKGGCVTGTYDTSICKAPCWMYIQEYDSTPKAWRVLTEEEVKPDGTFEIWFDEPLTSWFAFFNREDYEPVGTDYDTLMDAVTHIDYSSFNVSKLKDLLIESLPLVKSIVFPTYFPVLESLDFNNMGNLRTHTKIVVDNPIWIKYDNCPSILEIDFSGVDILGRPFVCRQCSNLRRVSLFDMRNYDYTDVEDKYDIYQLTYNTFLEDKELKEVTCINTDKITCWAQTFRMCHKLKKCDIEDYSETLRFYGTWNRCWALEEMDIMNTSKCEKFEYMFWDCYNLKRVEEIDFASCLTQTQAFYNCKNLKYLKIINLGKSTKTSYDLSEPLNWGTGGEENRQSLVDSLLTYSYDRAAEDMSNCTIKLSSTSKALLTEEELLAITNKGYTIS